MSRALYTIYQNNVLAFARTLVIKCQGVSEMINNELIIAGEEVDLDDPTTWKYYKNLAGEYHFTDTPMMIRSVDTLQPILFSKENLTTNRATFREYQYGTPLYNDLVQRFPLQVHLINSILNPVDKQTAIDAEDGDILTYSPQFIEANETNIIPQLQLWIKMFFGRWYSPPFMLTDDLYVASFLGILYQNIPMTLMNLRLRNIKTPFVHSFHLQQYLASNGQLDSFIPYLTQSQQLWLYRNIRYLQRHVGQQRVFDALVDNILTPRNIPLSWYRLRHHDANMPEDIYPTVQMVKYPINTNYIESGIETTDIPNLLIRQRPVARENIDVEDEALLDIEQKMGHGKFSSLPTKVLESEMVDRTNSSIRSFENVLINEWVYMATHQRYTAFVNIPNPGSGELMTMTVRDALIVAVYGVLRLSGYGDVDTIPRLHAYDVLRTPLPTRDELLTYLPNGARPEVLTYIQDNITPLALYNNTETFYNACNNLHQEYLRMWELYSFQDHMWYRAVYQQAVNAHFMHIKCNLVEETQSFEQWLQEKGYAIANLDDLQVEQLIIDTINIATGANLVTRRSLAEIQRELLKLMDQLTSYTVQFLSNINEENYWYIKEPEVRPGDMEGESEGYVRVPTPSLKALASQVDREEHYHVPTKAFDPDMSVTSTTEQQWGIDCRVNVALLPSSMADVRYDITRVGILGFSSFVENDIPDDNHTGQYSYPE